MIKFRTRSGVLRKLAWRPDGRELLTLELDGHSYQASHWTVEGEYKRTSYLGRARGPTPAYGGHVFAVADTDQVHVRDLHGETLYDVALRDTPEVGALALDADATRLASVRPWPNYELRSEIYVHELHIAGAVLLSVFHGLGRAFHVEFSFDARHLLVASDIGITLWDLAKKESAHVLDVLGLRTAQLSPDSAVFYLRKAKQVECRSTFDGRRRWEHRLAEVKSAAELAISPDGGMLAAADGEVVRLFVTSDGVETAAFHWRIGPIVSLTFAPDGLTIAAGSDDGQIVIWDVA